MNRVYQMPSQPVRVRKDKILSGSFWLLCIIGLWNLNGLTSMLFEANRLMSLAFLGLGCLILVRSKQWGKSIGKSGMAFCGFIFLYLAIGAMVRPEVGMIVSHVNSVFIVGVSAIASRRIILSRGFPFFLKILLILTTLGAWTVFLTPFLGAAYNNLGNSRMNFHAGRWMGFFANPNSCGMAGVCGLATCLTGLTMNSREFPFKGTIPFIIAFLGVGVLLTFSRTAILLYGTLAMCYGALTFKMNKHTISILFGGILLIVTTFWFFTGGYENFDWAPQQLRRIVSVERIIQGNADSADYGGRYNGISGGLAYWSKSPIIGHGLGSMHRMPVRYFGGLGCHNTHVMVLGESGVFGMAAYVFFLFVFGLKTWQMKYMPTRTFCVFFFLMLGAWGMVSHDMLEDRNLNILLGVCFAFLSLDKTLAASHRGKKYGR